jgi:transposase
MCIVVVVFVLPNPTSKEIREKIIHHKQNYVNEKDIANWLVISQSTATKIWALHKSTGSIKPRPRTQGRKPQVNKQTMDQITKQIEETPDITLKELIAEFKLSISPAALSKRLIKLGYTFKKRVFIQKNKKNQPL